MPYKTITKTDIVRFLKDPIIIENIKKIGEKNTITANGLLNLVHMQKHNLNKR